MGVLVDPWRHPSRLARQGAYVALGLPLGVVSFTTVSTLASVAISLLVTVVFAIPVIWALFLASRILGAVERSRTANLMDVRMADPVPPLAARGFFRRLWERCRTKARWRELGHHVLLLPVATVCFTIVSSLWAGSLALTSMPVVAGHLPGGTAKFWLFEVGRGPAAWGLAALGLVGLAVVAPWATVGAAKAQLALARWLVGTPRSAEIEAQLARVEAQRSAAVDAAEAERRRIERDLHDGAQQRLVALAANLGSAREKLETDPEGAKVLVADAHEEAKAALKEVRDLVRGIHPVILEDRGLDAALSAVVARSAIPVALSVQVDPRPPAPVESAAYFVVSEALTNVARHAQATRASVDIARAGQRLVIEVRDDGIGGADASRGTGLQGLRERVQGLGGQVTVISPDGGPTTISVELPCGS
ncbi:MAG: sensor histidine kinase [Acidimicrobiales bacterium]